MVFRRKLRETKLFDEVLFSDVKLKVCKSYDGCSDCYFCDKEKGAQECLYSESCFGDCRKDKNSVIFKKIEQ